MYVEPNFKSKKALKDALARGETVTVFQPGPFGGDCKDGTVSVEGPHFPEAHRWYARAVLKDGKVISVK